jgi:uncharacterized protein
VIDYASKSKNFLLISISLPIFYNPCIEIPKKLQYNYIIIMTHLRFEWDESQNISNMKKHGISFAEAKTVFYDENAIQFYDDDHSNDEERFIMLGFSNHVRLLIVCHCTRKNDSIIKDNFSSKSHEE